MIFLLFLALYYLLIAIKEMPFSDCPVDIKGIDKSLLLGLLWKQAVPEIPCIFCFPFTKEDATFAAQKFIYEFEGAFIGLDISGDRVCPEVYDDIRKSRMFRKGFTVQEIVDAIRKAGPDGEWPPFDEGKTLVDISGIDKVELLCHLWDRGRSSYVYRKVPFTRESAENAVKAYIDNFHGVDIKTDLTGDTANSLFYNRKHGMYNLFEVILDVMRFDLSKNLYVAYRYADKEL